jgi:hypothetical protein
MRYSPTASGVLGVLDSLCYYQMLQRKQSCVLLPRRTYMFLPCLSDTCAHIRHFYILEWFLLSLKDRRCVAGVPSAPRVALSSFGDGEWTRGLEMYAESLQSFTFKITAIRN